MRNDDIRSKFCIIRAEIKNANNIDASDLERFGLSLAENLRESDLVTEDETIYWCLLPTDNIDAIQRRLANIVSLAAKSNISNSDYKLSSYLFPRYSLHRIKSGDTLLETLSSTNGITPDKQLELSVSDTGTQEVMFVPLFTK